jgi:hypothetical protein
VWCRDCEHRWTVWHGERPKPGCTEGTLSLAPLTESEVRYILTSPKSGYALSRELGRSNVAISAIRNGRLHQNTCPDVPRWNQASVSCKKCDHWLHEQCGMGFPEPAEEGIDFAAECSLYVEVRD